MRGTEICIEFSYKCYYLAFSIDRQRLLLNRCAQSISIHYVMVSVVSYTNRI
jgi:hypothetical protein